MKKPTFHWPLLEVVLEGGSVVDQKGVLDGFVFEKPSSMNRFLHAYGYEIEDPVSLASLLGTFREALHFIREHFLYPTCSFGLKAEVPKQIIELEDMRDLFFMATLQYPGQFRDCSAMVLQAWACALLKVMHTIIHIDRDIFSIYFSDIQKQILDHFYHFIFRDKKGNVFFGGSKSQIAIPLVRFETKSKKKRESLIMKLLHKPEHVAEDVFDRVGIRFVTFTKIDALLLVQDLINRLIVLPTNIKPSRSKNTLIDLKSFQMFYEKEKSIISKKDFSEKDFLSFLEKNIRFPKKEIKNPHSSKTYRAIQFTCRKLIQIRNPLYKELRSLQKDVKEHPSEEIKKRLLRLDLSYLKRTVSFFYPFEVQIMDQKNYEESRQGMSAHEKYKKNQLHAVFQRVMGPVCDVAEK